MGVQRLEFWAVAVVKTWAFVGAHQRPLLVFFYALHEQVGHPQSIEEIACAHFLFSVIFLQVQEIENVCMPRFHVNGKASLALATPLVDIAGRIVENAQHGDDPVGCAIRSPDVRTCCTYIVNAESDPACRLADLGTLLQRVIDPVDAVVAHGQQEATGHLWLGGSRIEKRGRCVREILFGHQIIGLQCRLNVFFVDAQRYAHQHLLRTLNDLAVGAQQVGAFEGLESKVVVAEVPVIDDAAVDQRRVGFDDLHHIVCDQG